MRTWIGCSLALSVALLPRLSMAEEGEDLGDTSEPAPAEAAAGEAPEAESAPAPAPADPAPPVPAPADAGGSEPTPEAAQSAPSTGQGFSFGSYGRIGIGTDLRGSTPEQANVVAYGSRIAEPNYVEADLYYGFTASHGVDVRTVTTLALADQMFHYTGQFDAAPALRNLFAEATMNGTSGLWIGSRMVRGDDIYLLDFWPLDELNILGGGGWYRFGALTLQGGIGANRLLDPFQYQEREINDPFFGSQTIAQLDRQRLIASSKLSYRVLEPAQGPAGGLGVDASLYLEAHALGAGTRILADETTQALPRDFGYTLGGQLAGWGFADGASHLNLFARYSLGLAAYHELQAPTRLSPAMRTFPDANEFLLGMSGNYELPGAALVVGGYLRNFRSGTAGTGAHEEGWEYIVAARPHYEVVPRLLSAVDLSYQVRFPNGLNPVELIAQDPAVAQVAPMLIFAPSGAGAYDRPHFRLLYRAAFWNEGARNLFSPEDPRRGRTITHFLGLQAEWWFNSTYQ
jgi:hypothetical protein